MLSAVCSKFKKDIELRIKVSLYKNSTHAYNMPAQSDHLMQRNYF